MSKSTERGARAAFLQDLGASEAATAELLDYNENPFREQLESFQGQLPLPDEPHLEAWRGYCEETREVGIFDELRKRFVQFRFPIQEGISKSKEYLDATRKGSFPALPGHAGGLELTRPEGLELVLHPTPAGTIPLIITEERQDFVTLVRAFSARNEPETVPDSMGACIVKGLNNWDRIHTMRRRWEESREASASSTTWQDEFRRIIPQKELYQDRLIVLSRGPYSAVPAGSVGSTDEAWQETSLVIRREHECTHYFTLRVLGAMRNNLLDELIADYVGLVGAFGRYSTEPALLFLGLEDYPEIRANGRLHNYRGDPPLSDEAFEVLKQLVVASIRNLARLDAALGNKGRSVGGLAATILGLASTTLEELADEGSVEQLGGRVRRLSSED